VYINILRTKLNILQLKARVLGYKLVVAEFSEPSEPEVECIAMIQNKSKPLNIGSIGISRDTPESEPMLSCFLIDIKRWKWADTEGFSLTDMVDISTLKNEIFTPVKFSELAKRLK